MKTVAILQHAFFGGGGTRVLVCAIQVLNDLDIVPDIYCFKCLSMGEISKQFGKNVHYNIIKMRVPRIKGIGALKVPLLNLLARKSLNQYEVVFNSQGSFLFLPHPKHIVTYLHFPKKVEFMLAAKSSPGIKSWIYTCPVSWFYALENPNASELILVNSQFTKGMLLRYYHSVDPATVHVLYPPVDLSIFWCESEDRKPFISSVGSFGSAKNQIAQIKLSKQMPEFEFHIMGGSAVDPGYYQQCKELVETANIENVFLHPDISLSQLISYLRQSRFFIHTRLGEHFGISTVEAIAAGCIPIVPNSGGQKEIVPDKRLRFDSIGEIPDIIRMISRESLRDIRKALQSHIQQFDEGQFKSSLRLHFLNKLS